MGNPPEIPQSYNGGRKFIWTVSALVGILLGFITFVSVAYVEGQDKGAINARVTANENSLHRIESKLDRIYYTILDDRRDERSRDGGDEP
jgi:hypothetical protein